MVCKNKQGEQTYEEQPLAIPAVLEPYTASMWSWHGSELEELVGYESFRDGFILKVRLMMEIACGQNRFSEND